MIRNVGFGRLQGYRNEGKASERIEGDCDTELGIEIRRSSD